MTKLDNNRPIDLPAPPAVLRTHTSEPAEEPSELDNTNAGNPDAMPGKDRPDQRPITDNKAGG
jgi:hypothetical protein